MASLRKQVAAYDAQINSERKKVARTAKRTGVANGGVTQSFKGLNQHAAYRGAYNKSLRGGSDAMTAHKAGQAAQARNEQGRARIAEIEAQFKNRKGKKAQAERAAAIKEASSGLSPLKS
jgi:membrane protease subunit (stomatin/prohibitin family)